MKAAIITFSLVVCGTASLAYVPSENVDSFGETAIVVRAKRQCGGGGGCCAGMCSCGQMGQCGQVCCPAPPPPCSCGTPGCQQCVTNTVLVPVQQTTCCKCCQPVCTQACMNGGGCGCGCTRGGCGRKRRSLLAIASEEMTKAGEHMV